MEDWFWLIGVPVATPIIWETARRIGARLMTYQKLTAACSPVGDEYGHRKWDVTLARKDTPKWARWLLDVPGSYLEDATVYGRFYNEIDRGWEPSGDGTIWSFVWSSRIPEDAGWLLGDLTRLTEAKRVRITKQDHQTVAVVMKSNTAPQVPFVLDPRAYAHGLPGTLWGTDGVLTLNKYVLVLKVCHADDTKGQLFFFQYTNDGGLLRDFKLRVLPKDVGRRFTRYLRHDDFLRRRPASQ